MKLKLNILMACSLYLASACTGGALLKSNVIHKRYVQYGVDLLPETWQKKSFRGADLFFVHKNHDAMIFLHSQCEKFSDSPLEALTAQLLVGMGKYEITSDKRIALSDREALISEVNVKLDGVNRYLKIMVLRKNRCVFDVVFSANPNARDIVTDYDALIATFWAEAEL